MKKFLVLQIVFLSFCVMADERIAFWSLERDSAEDEYQVLGIEFERNETLNGFGARLFSFKEEGLYLGASFAYLLGDREVCVLGGCQFSDAIGTMIGGEIGRDLGKWTPFVGVSFSRSKVELKTRTDNEEIWGLNAGLWLELDTFKLRGAVTNLDDEDNRVVAAGILFQFENKFAVGTEFGMLLDSEVDGFKFSLQIGRAI